MEFEYYQVWKLRTSFGKCVLFGSLSLWLLLSALRVNKHPATTEEEEEAA